MASYNSQSPTVADSDTDSAICMAPSVDEIEDEHEELLRLTHSKRNPAPLPLLSDKVITLSTRVWIGDLHLNTSIRQILSAVRGVGGIIQVDMAPVKVPVADGTHYWASIASVVFRSEQEARNYLTFTQEWGMLLEQVDQDGSTLQPLLKANMQNMSLVDRGVPEPGSQHVYAHPISTSLKSPLHEWYDGATRSLRITHVPKTSVWFVLNVVGLTDLIHAEHHCRRNGTSILDLEFTSVWDASHAADRLRYLGFIYHNGFVTKIGKDSELPKDGAPYCSFIRDHCDGKTDDEEYGLLSGPGFIEWKSDKEFLKFDQLPYNVDWPVNHHSCMRHSGLLPRTVKEQIDLIRKSSCYPRNMKSWSWDIVDGPCPVTRETAKALWDTMEREGEWAQAWNTYFNHVVPKLSNFINWRDYSMISEHRRHPEVCNNNECACHGEFENSAVPEVISRFLAGEIEVQGGIDDRVMVLVSHISLSQWHLPAYI